MQWYGSNTVKFPLENSCCPLFFATNILQLPYSPFAEVTCGTPSKVQNGNWSYQTGKKDSYNDTVTYKCNQGFSLSGGEKTENVTCQANGTWSTAPTCTFGTGKLKTKCSYSHSKLVPQV
jgi:hypothetical protein